MAKPRALITGITGMVGSHLAEYLVANTDWDALGPCRCRSRVPKEKLPINEECTFHPASPYAISKVGTDLIGRFYAEAYRMMVMVTRMFTHTGPRRGDVFAESTFAKQIALIEAGLIEPVVKV